MNRKKTVLAVLFHPSAFILLFSGNSTVTSQYWFAPD
jgi:hypothetical protein